MIEPAALLARGPWEPGEVDVRWHQAAYEPSQQVSEAADARVAELSERGSPAHDGMAARMRDHEARDGGLWMELQPARWALRLVDSGACDSLTALCVVRREDGCWLAGRRASWLATWSGRWALGAGGAVEVGRARSRRSPASWRRSGSCARRGSRWRRWCAFPVGW